MNHRGYAARIEYSDDDKAFVGHIAGIRDIVGFHADTVKDLEAAFKEAVDDYLETCKAVGKEPQKPYSGKMMLRIAKDLHARVAMRAESMGKSINQWVEDTLDAATRAG